MRNKRARAVVAVVGTGIIGRSWIRVFARRNYETRVYDCDPKQLSRAIAWFDEDIRLDREDGFLSAKSASNERAHIKLCRSLGEALRGASYVQENGPEDLKSKKSLYAELDRVGEPETILASSTSGHDMSEIAAGLPGANRCIVAHPVNPPHIIPVVEVLPGKLTDPAVIARTCALLEQVGQKPVLMHYYVRNFLLNRMQAALIREAIQLAERNVADVDAIDTVIREGLGLRWALMGPLGVADSNADGGVREYFTRFRQPYVEGMEDLYSTPSLDDEMIERLGNKTDAMAGAASRPQVRRWRDRMIRKIRALKEADPAPWTLPSSAIPPKRRRSGRNAA
jgi:L-gulonate 3-dehydrogenase